MYICTFHVLFSNIDLYHKHLLVFVGGFMVGHQSFPIGSLCTGGNIPPKAVSILPTPAGGKTHFASYNEQDSSFPPCLLVVVLGELNSIYIRINIDLY